MKEITILNFFLIPFLLQSQDLKKSTNDLSILVGNWDIIRTYTPDSNEARVLKGKLSCEWALDSTFINCRYLMDRPGKKRGIDEVYFNYNSIYDKYESIWMSSTWPIKVLMTGELAKNTLTTSAEFPISEKIIEYVSGTLKFNENQSSDQFIRKTYIRTSKESDWTFHMIEEGSKNENEKRR